MLKVKFLCISFRISSLLILRFYYSFSCVAMSCDTSFHYDHVACRLLFFVHMLTKREFAYSGL